MEDQIGTLRAAGFDDQEISEWATQTRSTLSAAGFKDNEIDGYISGGVTVRGEPIPAYAARIATGVNSGDAQGAVPINSLGLNLKSSTSRLKGRKYLSVDETEAALKSKFPEAAIARNIKANIMAMKQERDAIAGRSLVEAVKDYGRKIGSEQIAEDFKPSNDYFTIDHPALKTWRPKLEKAEDGSWSIVQNAVNVVLGNSTLSDEAHGYWTRLQNELAAKASNPWAPVPPWGVYSFLQGLSATAGNEPGKQDRVHIGYAKDGTAIYAKSPMGRIGEELSGHQNDRKPGDSNEPVRPAKILSISHARATAVHGELAHAGASFPRPMTQGRNP